MFTALQLIGNHVGTVAAANYTTFVHHQHSRQHQIHNQQTLPPQQQSRQLSLKRLNANKNSPDLSPTKSSRIRDDDIQ